MLESFYIYKTQMRTTTIVYTYDQPKLCGEKCKTHAPTPLQTMFIEMKIKMQKANKNASTGSPPLAALFTRPRGKGGLRGD